MPLISKKSPKACSAAELTDFMKLVIAGGQVDPHTLPGLVAESIVLAFAHDDVTGAIMGVAALKVPDATYRSRCFRKAGVDLEAQANPWELGWVFVSPEYEGKGVAKSLVAELTRDLASPIYATSLTTKVAMHKAMMHAGFERAGKTYKSTQTPGEEVALFVRVA